MSEQTQGAPATPAAPAPDSPEYREAMVKAYESQGVEPGATTEPPSGATPAAGATTTETDPNAPAPRLTDKPQGEGEDKTDETKPEDKPVEKKEGEETTDEDKDTPKAPSLADLFNDGTFVSGFNAEKLPENLSVALEAAGLDKDMQSAIHEQFRAGQAALQREATAKLHEAAGGQDQFNALVAWGQKNLTPEQAEFYDQQLNGPMAGEAIALLMQKMNAGRDPSLVNVSGAQGGPVSAFRDQSEMMAAMSDPRYHTSEAFRAEVAARLNISRF